MASNILRAIATLDSNGLYKATLAPESKTRNIVSIVVSGGDLVSNGFLYIDGVFRDGTSLSYRDRGEYAGGLRLPGGSVLSFTWQTAISNSGRLMVVEFDYEDRVSEFG